MSSVRVRSPALENILSECPFHHIANYDPESLDDDRLVIIANELYDTSKFSIDNATNIVVGSPKRDWMDKTRNKFAYRCLPLIVANTLGWQILCPHEVDVVWNGGKSISDLSVHVNGPYKFASSHFGDGVLTFTLPFLIRTTKNHDLYVKGPTNLPKRGIHALEGLVETDWLTFTFTMNWKMTEPGKKIRFEKGEPFCQFFPYPKNYISDFDPILKTPSECTLEMYEKYNKKRIDFNEYLKIDKSPDAGKKWQKFYFRGEYPEDDFDVKCTDLGFDHNTTSQTKPFSDQRNHKNKG